MSGGPIADKILKDLMKTFGYDEEGEDIDIEKPEIEKKEDIRES
jgi:hypothetical protein